MLLPLPLRILLLPHQMAATGAQQKINTEPTASITVLPFVLADGEPEDNPNLFEN